MRQPPPHTQVPVPGSFRSFLVVWAGQSISMLGSALTIFALPLWVLERSAGDTLPYTTMGALYFASMIVTTALSGVLVDRFRRKTLLVISDLAAAIITLITLILLLTDHLTVSSLYWVNIVSGLAQGLQSLTLSTTLTMLVKKEHYVRSASMLELSTTVSTILAPVIAGSFFALVADDTGRVLQMVLMIDLISFVVAVTTLLPVPIPQPPPSQTQKQGGWWSELTYGIRYITTHRALLYLQLIFALSNAMLTIGRALLPPLILMRSDANEWLYGLVMTAGGVGGVLGGTLVSLTGGFKRRLLHGVLLGWSLTGLLGLLLLALSPWPAGWLVGSMMMYGLIPLIGGSNQAIWQIHVPADVQGKVFAVRRVFAWLIVPLAWVSAGWLSDHLFEPYLAPRGWLPLIPPGPGSGMAALMAIAGLIMAVVGLGGYGIPALHRMNQQPQPS